MSTVEDKLEIIDRLYLMAEILDRRAWDRVPEVMVPDADAYGCDGIDDVVANSFRRYLGGCGPSQHLLGNHRVTVEGDTASSVTKVRVYHQGKDERSELFYECLGWYHDRWTRTPDGWRMTYRRIDVDIALGDIETLQPG